MGLSQRHAKLLNTRGYETQQLSSLLSDNLHPSRRQAYKPVVRRRPPPGTASIHYPARRISIAGPRTRAVRPAVVTTDQRNRVRGSAAALALLDDARLFPLLPNLARVLQYQRRRSQFCLPCGRVRTRNEDLFGCTCKSVVRANPEMCAVGLSTCTHGSCGLCDRTRTRLIEGMTVGLRRSTGAA